MSNSSGESDTMTSGDSLKQFSEDSSDESPKSSVVEDLKIPDTSVSRSASTGDLEKFDSTWGQHVVKGDMNPRPDFRKQRPRYDVEFRKEPFRRPQSLHSACSSENPKDQEGIFGYALRFHKGSRGLQSPSIGVKTYQKSSPRKKFKWHDPVSKHVLTAGGILFYDDQGVWLIGEKDKNGIVYTDIGGRYAYEDGNIWATIARELREETYGICEMFASEITSLSNIYPPVYVNGHDNQPVYACLVIPICAMKLESRTHFSLDPVAFDIQRQKTISENPDVPEDYYCPCVLTKLTYEELKNTSFRLSFRLKRVLKFSSVFSAIHPRSEPWSPYDTEEENADEHID